MGIIFKTIKTPCNYYIYDRNTSSITAISKEEYDYFNSVEKERIQLPENSELILQMQKKGVLLEDNLKSIEHPDTKYLNHKLDTQVEKLTLQVTQNCNLRCSYCTYSGNYDNQRGHSNKNMSIECMRKGIDFLMKHSRDVEEVNVGFYGGEPLLRKDLIKDCLNYIDENYFDKKVSYSMTTNGTLLSKDVIEMFMEHDITISISLDGPEEVHDKNRIKIDGTGSYKTIIENLTFIKNQYPSFFKKLRFSPVIDTETSLEKIINFFETTPVISELDYSVKTISDYDSNDLPDYGELFLIQDNIEMAKVILYMLKKTEIDSLTKSYIGIIAQILHKHKLVCSMSKMPECSHPGGPCVPGLSRLFADVEGNLFPCERVPENLEEMIIGTIDTGFDYESVKSMLNIGQLSERECANCWCFKLCSSCAAACIGENGVSKKVKLSRCPGIKYSGYQELRILCLLKDFDYNFKEEQDA